MERTARAPSEIRADLRAWLDMLAVSEAIGDPEGVGVARREVEALERELDLSRYGDPGVSGGD